MRWLKQRASAALVVTAALILLLDSTDSAMSQADKDWHRADFGWSVTEKPPEAGPCGAILADGKFNTVLFVNASGRLILSEFDSDWSLKPGQKGVTLSIDDAPVGNVNVLGIHDEVTVAISNDAAEQQLLRAKSLEWHFPDRDYRVTVHDVDRAAASVRSCESLRPKQH